jgi:hypothetical protein
MQNSIRNFNFCYQQIKSCKTVHDALTTFKTYNTVSNEYSSILDFEIKDYCVFKDEHGLFYTYVWNLPESDIATNIFTENDNVNIYINNNGVLIPIKTTNIINTLLINKNKISLILKFTNNQIPKNIKLHFTGFLLNNKSHCVFYNYINNKCQFNTMTSNDNCLILY